MRKVNGWLAVAALVSAGGVQAEDAYLRVRCDGASAGAQLQINGVKKGACPMDLAIPAGRADIQATKDLGRGQYKTFEQSLTLEPGTAKRISVEFGNEIQFTPEGRQLEDQRLAAERVKAEQAAKEEAQRQRIAAAQEAARAEQERAAAEYEASKGQVIRYMEGVENGDSSELTSFVASCWVFLPLSTTTDVLSGKRLASHDPAAFANPESLMARVQRNAKGDSQAALAAR